MGDLLSNLGLINSESSHQAEELFELGKLRGELGDFTTSILKLEAAGQIYSARCEHRLYIKCLTLCLRMQAEMENQRGLHAIKEHLDEYVLAEGMELNSTTYYTLALIESYRGNHDKTLELLDRALAKALAADDKEAMCFAMQGLAAVYWSLGRTDDSLKEIQNLRVFFQVLKLPDLEVSSQILHGYILVSLKRYNEALSIYWKAFEALKSQKNLYTYVSLLFAMAFTHGEAEEYDLAKTYAKLAQEMSDPKHFVYLLRRIDEFNQRIRLKEQHNVDLIFTAATNSVLERKKGKINFKNQFILLDMLKLFVRHPGEVYSKEALVKAVWKQDYDPAVHDNKIYVTIKRLRQLIEPDFDKPKYIYRAKNGYYLNRNVKVVIEP